MGTLIIINIRKAISDRITTGIPSITNIPNMKNSPKSIAIIIPAKPAKSRAENAENIKPAKSPAAPLNVIHRIIVKDRMNKLGMKNSMEGIICRMKRMNVPKVAARNKTKLNIMERTVDIMRMKRDGMKRIIDGNIYNINNPTTTINHIGNPNKANGAVIKFHIHHSGHVSIVIGHIKAFNISPIGHKIIQLKG